MKMKAQSILLLLLGASAVPFACSTGGSDPFASSAGAPGSSAGGPSTGSGGGTAVPTEAGMLPPSVLTYEAATVDSTIFGKLTEDPCDSGDICCEAFEWPVAAPLPNIMMNTGALVKQDGKLYQYIGTETVTWPLPGCGPKSPTLYHCSEGRWWKDLGTTCSSS